MAVTTFSPLLGLALPTTGDLSGTWGTTVNDSITSLIDSAVAGTTTLSADADVTLSTTNGAANQARNAVLLCTGARTAIKTLTAPAQSKAYILINKTSGGFAVKLVGAGPTTGVSVLPGFKALVAWDGADFVTISSGLISATASTSSELQLYEAINNGTSYVALKAPTSLAATTTFTLPSADGTVNQSLVTDGSGTLSFTAVAGFSTMVTSTSTSTFTIPAGIIIMKVTVVGGGGGSGGGGLSSTNGASGGNTTLASGTQSITTITGGGGGGGFGNGETGGSGGTATNGTTNITGGAGGSTNNGLAGTGGSSAFGGGGKAGIFPTGAGSAGGAYGGGGGGSAYGSFGASGSGGGGGGGTAIKYLTGLTPGNTLAVTIGAGGAAGTGAIAGAAGAAGVVIFEY